MGKTVSKGDSFRFTSKLAAADGEWRVYNLRGGDAHLGRLGQRGEMLSSAVPRNLLTLPVDVIAEALAVGTAERL